MLGLLLEQQTNERMIIRWWISIILLICDCIFIISNERIKCGQYNLDNDIKIATEDGQLYTGQLPFVADIQATTHDEQDKNITINCSGVIISRSQILTSVQCLGESAANTTYLVRLGSLKQFQGQPIEVDRNGIYFIETNGREPDCGEPLIRQGLAILTLRKKLTYTLRGGHELNKICLKRGDVFHTVELGQDLNTTGWFFGNEELKMLKIQPIVCPNQLDLICKMPPVDKSKEEFLQEGAPLFHNYHENRWALVGIHSGNFNPWVKACHKSKPSSLLAYIKLNTGIYREWLKSKLITA